MYAQGGRAEMNTAGKDDDAGEEWPGVDVSDLVGRLRRFNDWRRGAEIKQPQPKEIGEDLEEAADRLEAMAGAIVAALENNLHLADGDNCTLIDLVRVARANIAGC